MTACESKALCTRAATVPISVAIRLACAVSWPMSGRVAPGHFPPPTAAASSNAWRMLGSTGGGSLEINVAAHSPNNDAEAAMTAGFAGGVTPE